MNKSSTLARHALLTLALSGCFASVAAFADTPPQDIPVRLQSLLEPDTEAPKPRPLTIKGWRTTMGSKVLFIRTTASPMFDVHVSFDAGSIRGNVAGLAATTFSMLNEGIPGMDNHQAVIAAFENQGAELGMHFDQQRSAFSLRSLSAVDKRTPALHLFSQILGKPLLSDKALALVKNEMKNRLQNNAQNPSHIALQQLKEQLAPQSPYASPALGTKEGLESLTRQAVQDFHRQAYSARTTQITLVGDLTLEEAQLISQQISGALPNTLPASPTVPSLPPATAPTRSHLERTQRQTHLLLAQPSVPRKHDDHLALEAARRIFDNRLSTALRQERGLVYGTDIQNWNWAANGLMVIALRTSPQYSQGIEALTRSMFDQYLRDGPTQRELDQLKRRTKSQNAHDSSSNAQILLRLVHINREDRPLDLDYDAGQMQRLSLEQIKQALNRHLAAERWHVVTTGPSVDQHPLPTPTTTPDATSSKDTCRAGQVFMAS
ncbi:M16 family metallopeptidase [Pseudomonas sp. ABY48]|uniref:M16 family metallopeptidase n=1 Tax=Pseudomonas sp. ABY48 TaxID=3402865 RepID=UPI003B430C23